MLEIKSLIESTKCDIEKTKNEILDKLNTEVERISLLVSNLTNRIDMLEKRNNYLERKHLETFDHLSDKVRNCQSLQKENNAELLNEFEQRLNRRNNVIIFGLAEQVEGAASRIGEIRM